MSWMVLSLGLWIWKTNPLGSARMLRDPIETDRHCLAFFWHKAVVWPLASDAYFKWTFRHKSFFQVIVSPTSIDLNRFQAAGSTKKPMNIYCVSCWAPSKLMEPSLATWWSLFLFGDIIEPFGWATSSFWWVKNHEEGVHVSMGVPPNG